MDTTQQATASLMIKHFYSDAIRKTIAIYIAKDILEIESSLVMESKKLSKEVLFKIKREVLVEILKTQRVKQTLLWGLKKLETCRDDVLAEILKNYGIDNFEESTIYHDNMKIIFSDYLELFKNMVKNEKIEQLVHHIRDCL